MSQTALGPGVEFDAIRTLLERWGDLAVGIGDDAAAFAVPRGEQIVTSVDAAVEHRHFRREWLSPREVACRAVTAALSDLAAMGARPLGILVSLIVPDDWRAELLDIGDGIGDAVRDAGTVVRGGNIAAGSELSITTTVFGAAFAPLMRSGVRVGDRIYVTGRLGGPGAALRRFLIGEEPGVHRERFARPRARLREGQWLVRAGVTAAIDLSDGLLGDLRHLAAASGVGITIDASRVPLVEGITAEQGLSSGEEYELIVASPVPLDTGAFEARFGIPVTAIGNAGHDGAGEVKVIGARVANVASHDHLSR